MSRTGRARIARTVSAIFAAGTVAACVTSRSSIAATRPTSAPSAARGTTTARATEEARARQALSRLTFGPRYGDVDRVLAMGVDRWIDRQLHPETIVDNGARVALARDATWTGPIDSVLAAIGRPAVRPNASTRGGAAAADPLTALRPAFLPARAQPFYYPLETRDELRDRRAPTGFDLNLMVAGRYTRAEFSDQQLTEVLTDFWENHFSVYGPRFMFRPTMVEWDRRVIRPHVLGRFRDLLGAVAHSPAMLNYLDNGQNRAGTLNQNFARQLLKLHTLGVDGGYTSNDAMAVARAFTGWTSQFPAGDSYAVLFAFRPQDHDTAAKVVLGHALPAGRGIEDGEAVLDILARHPATAHLIAQKLAVRFVSDTPPEALVARAAATFLRTDGDLREVVRTIVTSPEFFAESAAHAKVKTPVEFLLSARRVLGAPVDTAGETIDLMLALAQGPFGHVTPDGWPETATAWTDPGAIDDRTDIATRIGAGTLPSIPVERWPVWRRLSTAPFDQQMAGVIHELLGGTASDSTRATLSAAHGKTGEAALRELLARALSSPEFQRR